MKKIITFIGTGLLALSLASCSVNQPLENLAPTPSPVETVVEVNPEDLSSTGVNFNDVTPEDLKYTMDDEYLFISSANAEGSIKFVESDDPRVADIDKYLKMTGTKEAMYLEVEVDNRKGTEVANMYEVTFYDPEGVGYRFEKAMNLVDLYSPVENSDGTYWTGDGFKELTKSEYSTLKQMSVSMDKELTWALDPMEKGTFILVAPHDGVPTPTEFEGVQVMAHGVFDEVRAYDVLASEYKEWKMAKEAQ